MDAYERHLGAIRRVAEQSLMVRDITVANVWGPAPDDAVSIALSRMESEDFDTAPLVESPLTRFVTKRSLASLPGDLPVEHAARTISAEDLVTSTLPLADALHLLDEREWFFVIEGHEVQGIITIADLQSLTVSLVVLGFVLAAEAGIDALIGKHTPDRWEELLSQDRLASIESVFQERRSRNAEIDRVACLNLDERLRILSKSPELRSAMGMSRTRLDDASEAVKRLRDTLAHGGSIIDVRDDPREGIRAAQQARDLADLIWAALETADQATGDSARP